MKLFDLHCDTVTKAFTENKSLFSGEMHINLKKAGYIENYKQCFALWIDDSFKGRPAFSFCSELIDFYQKEIERMKKAAENSFRPVLTIENGSALCGDADNIPYFAGIGVRMITLTWNGENELGYGVGTGCSKGLKPFGKAAIKVMENENIIIDKNN